MLALNRHSGNSVIQERAVSNTLMQPGFLELFLASAVARGFFFFFFTFFLSSPSPCPSFLVCLSPVSSGKYFVYK